MNIRQLFILTFLFICLSEQDLFSQKIEKLNGDTLSYQDKLYDSVPPQRIVGQWDGKYSFNNKVYKYKDLGFVLSKNTKAFSKFEGALSAKDDARKFGLTTLGAMAFGTLSIVLDNNTPEHCEWFCLSTGDILGLASWLFIVPVAAGATLVSATIFLINQGRSISIYNSDQDISQFQKESTLNLSLGFSNNGVGVHLRF